MDDRDSVSSNKCTLCGQDIPATACDVPDCQATPEVTQEVAQEVTAEPGACQKCGATEIPCVEPECPAVLAHEMRTYVCQVCARSVTEGETCDRSDCPRVAVDQIRKASIDTPFKLGL
jgi:hypothetical protein